MSVNITANGEITFDVHTKDYTVWDETYSEEVCVTKYKFIAMVALKTYVKYLDGDFDDLVMAGNEVDCHQMIEDSLQGEGDE